MTHTRSTRRGFLEALAATAVGTSLAARSTAVVTPHREVERFFDLLEAVA